MASKTVELPDGRYLIYYTFGGESPAHGDSAVWEAAGDTTTSQSGAVADRPAPEGTRGQGAADV
jgi:hypothetical protein